MTQPKWHALEPNILYTVLELYPFTVPSLESVKSKPDDKDIRTSDDIFGLERVLKRVCKQWKRSLDSNKIRIQKNLHPRPPSRLRYSFTPNDPTWIPPELAGVTLTKRGILLRIKVYFPLITPDGAWAFGPRAGGGNRVLPVWINLHKNNSDTFADFASRITKLDAALLSVGPGAFAGILSIHDDTRCVYKWLVTAVVAAFGFRSQYIGS